MFKDNTVLDVRELRLNWAIDDVCGAVEQLTTQLEKCKDIETLEATARLLRSMQTYIRVVKEMIDV